MSAAFALHLYHSQCMIPQRSSSDILRDSNNVQVVYPHMEETCRSKSDDGGPHIAVGDHLYPEYIRDGTSAKHDLLGATERSILFE